MKLLLQPECKTCVEPITGFIDICYTHLNVLCDVCQCPTWIDNEECDYLIDQLADAGFFV